MKSDIVTRFGRRVRTLRLSRGWRQIDLAAHAEMEPTYLSKLERGKQEVCLKTIERLADALEIRPADLLK